MAKPNGPYPTPELSYWVRNDAPGVFILSKDGKGADYLGVSEKDIKSAIESLADRLKGSWFLCCYAEYPPTQFKVECEWYHAYRPPVEHPTPPESLPTLKCPILDCEFHI